MQLLRRNSLPANEDEFSVGTGIVDDVKGQGNGFRDLIVAIVLSEAFAVK